MMDNKGRVVGNAANFQESQVLLRNHEYHCQFRVRGDSGGKLYNDTRDGTLHSHETSARGGSKKIESQDSFMVSHHDQETYTAIANL